MGTTARRASVLLLFWSLPAVTFRLAMPALLPFPAWAVDYTYKLSWLPVTQDTDGNPITVEAYRVENGLCLPGSPKTSVTVTETSTTVTAPKASYCWRVYAQTSGLESDPSTPVVFHSSLDTDGDGVLDFVDNCTLVHNPAQIDADNDGYGNACDGDLNNDGATNAFDTMLFRQEMGKVGPFNVYSVADLDGNGFVNAFDTPIFRSLLGKPPGPSGLRQ